MRDRKYFAGLLMGILLLAFLVSGCQSAKEGDSRQADLKEEGTFHIVTSFYPVYVATLNVTQGIDGVEVVNMTKPQTGCLHDYQLTTENMKTLEKAKVFVVNGAGMESFLDKAIKAQKDMKLADASEGITLLKDEAGENPHVWLSVPNEILQVKNIARQLGEADKAHAEAYQKNADAYIAKLNTLAEEMHKELDNVPQKDIVTFHEAFPYFADEFHLNIISVVEREPGTEPTPLELEKTIQQVKGLSSKVLFTEPQYSPHAAETIARETGAVIYPLDPIVTGDADEPQEKTREAYLERMRENMKVLKKALAGNA